MWSNVVTIAKEVDHIIAKAHGGTDDMSNLEAICIKCHRTKTAKEKHQHMADFKHQLASN